MEKKNHHGGEFQRGEIDFDFSVNINPLGMPEAAKRALFENWSVFEDYPDDGCRELRRALGRRFGLEEDRVVCGNGASDLIYRLCSVAGFRRVLLPAPSFSEYSRALRAAGCEVTELLTEQGRGFVFGEEQLAAVDPSFDALFLCNPSNPAGGLMEAPLLEDVLKRCERCGVVAVVDECFLDFVEDGEVHSAVSAASRGKNVVVLKAFTKIFAMAGLRLGFALFGDPALAERVFHFGAPWQVSGPAQAAGLAILGEWPEADGDGDGGCASYIQRTAEYIAAERARMEASLQELGLETVPGRANYILFRGRPGLDRLLAKQRIAIRNCSDYSGLGSQAEGLFTGSEKYSADPTGSGSAANSAGPVSTGNAAADAGGAGAANAVSTVNSMDPINTGNVAADAGGADAASAGNAAAAENTANRMETVYYRAAVKKPEENRILIQQIGRCLKWL